MVKLLGHLEDVRFVEIEDRVVMQLYSEHGPVMAVDLDERLVLMLLWAADRVIDNL